MEDLLYFIFFVIMMLILLLIELFPVIIVIIIIKSLNKNKNKKKQDILQKLLIYEPNFNVEQFNERAKEGFYALCEAKSNCDMEQLRLLESYELFNIHQVEINNAINNNSLNVTHINSFGKIDYIKFEIDGNNLVLGCKVWVTTTNLTIIPQTKNVMQQQDKIYHQIYLEFIKLKDANIKQGNEFIINNCPNCGAIVDITGNGRCTYCNSLLINGQTSWVINRIEEYYPGI